MTVVDGEQLVRCTAGHGYEVRNGYLDCSQGSVAEGTTGQTLASFGFEWNSFDDVRDEDEGFAEVYFRDIDLAGLEGRVGLDAGCGKGRYTRFLAEHLGAVAALDGSAAVEAAARNLSGIPSVLVVKSDLRAAPFAPESFDFISSLGVLHHLDDPQAGFDRLVTHLAPGAADPPLPLQPAPDVRTPGRGPGPGRSGALRHGATSAPDPETGERPHRRAPLRWRGLPGAYGDREGVAGLSRLPMDAYRGKPLRSLVLDTFDRLSAPVEHRYVWKDLEPWFRQAGLVVDAARDETGWFIVAHKT